MDWIWFILGGVVSIIVVLMGIAILIILAAAAEIAKGQIRDKRDPYSDWPD
jgi:hypothetical protein